MALQTSHLPVSAIKKLCHLRDPVVVTPTSRRTWRNFDSISFVSGLISNATVGIITLIEPSLKNRRHTEPPSGVHEDQDL